MTTASGEPPRLLRVWPDTPPGETLALPPEADTSDASSRAVAGRPVIRLGNVSTPTLEIYQPADDVRNGTCVLICPGGGHRILAYDLEGTEVAEWLQSKGVTAAVLKYRVPGRREDKIWEAAVQDAQRAMSVLRTQAAALQIDPDRIGILGFSAGGQAAALATLLPERQYPPLDEADRASNLPNFCVLIYPAYLVNDDRTALRPEATVTKATPPMFLVHAYDDPVAPESSILLALAAKQVGCPAELHLFATGGHGYGLRATEEPVTGWPVLCEAWLKRGGWLTHGK